MTMNQIKAENMKEKWLVMGCYETIEAAIESIKEHLPGQSVQYLAEDTETGKEIIGNI